MCSGFVLVRFIFSSRIFELQNIPSTSSNDGRRTIMAQTIIELLSTNLKLLLPDWVSILGILVDVKMVEQVRWEGWILLVFWTSTPIQLRIHHIGYKAQRLLYKRHSNIYTLHLPSPSKFCIWYYKSSIWHRSLQYMYTDQEYGGWEKQTCLRCNHNIIDIVLNRILSLSPVVLVYTIVCSSFRDVVNSFRYVALRSTTA